MTDATLTYLYFLLDRSGSMQSIRTDTEGGFDAFITEQRGLSGRCRVTLAQFDDRYEEVYADRDLADVPPLVLAPRGSTALLDALGRVIVEAGERLAALPEDQRPGSVIVGVITDGYENASREWTHPRIKDLIEQQTRDYGWQFLYLGADQDAIEEGAKKGFAARQVDDLRPRPGQGVDRGDERQHREVPTPWRPVPHRWRPSTSRTSTTPSESPRARRHTSLRS